MVIRGSYDDSRRSILLVLFLLYALFFLLFSGILRDKKAFWALMSGGVILITFVCHVLDSRYAAHIFKDLRSDIIRKIILGVCSGAMLYGVFCLGDTIFRWLIPQSSSYVKSVYTLRSGQSGVVLVLILAFIIGPGEEFIWRAFIQRHLQYRLESRYAIVASILLYTAVHIPSLNPMLILAACICGIMWSLTYYFSGSILINLISHSLWDVLVFVLIPFRG